MDRKNSYVDRVEHGGGTRLSRWHPYPAMVADQLALQLASTHVRPGMRILDPFCGTGRLLLAAARTAGTVGLGLDVNPLACLLTEAKIARPNVELLGALRREIDTVPRIELSELKLRNTKVEWFSKQTACELSQIVSWLNNAALPHDDLLVVAACLSAATREAAWIRKSGWKLHRMDSDARKSYAVSAWERFKKKLDHYLLFEGQIPVLGALQVKNYGAASIELVNAKEQKFDLIITSPPYGDSRTTVQYGAASGICLDVISRLNGLESLFVAGGAIDRACLGGTRERSEINFDLRDYWAGGSCGEPAKRAKAFLQDYEEVLASCYDVLSPGGSFVIIVGRRSLGGYRLRLDDFTRDVLLRLGCSIQSVHKRRLAQKSAPRTINRFGRATDSSKRHSGATRTMDSEIILTLTKHYSSCAELSNSRFSS